ncbi:MAG: hypothetical protein Fur0028_06230 [Bacteroidales bacterium]
MEDTKKIIESNKRFEAQLSWGRKTALEMRQSIAEFIYDNFELHLPEWRNQYKKIIDEATYLSTQPIDIGPDRAEIAEKWMYIHTEMYEIINLYYKLIEFNKSVAAQFFNGKDMETFTLFHTYSKHKLDPVWNKRKSQLIRKIYRNYIIENQLWQYHPIHIVLTLPHKDGHFRGKKFYAKELRDYFTELRDSKWWKKNVYGGEYGIEIKRSQQSGLHIHIHSFTLLYKNVSVNEFRAELRKRWTKLIKHEGTAIVWAETLYYYKKDHLGRYVTRPLRNDEYKPDEIETIEAPDGMFETYALKERKVRIKTYIDKEIDIISKNKKLTPEQRNAQITEAFLYGTLECIKYHFKQDALYLEEKNKLYDIELMLIILKSTKHVRLYSRFGAFYKEEKLNFNNVFREPEPDQEPEPENIDIPENSDDDLPFEYIWKDQETAEPEHEENIMAKRAEPVNPFTGEMVHINECRLVAFDPANRRYHGKHTLFPYKSYPAPEEIFTEIPAKIKLSELFKLLIFGKL